MIAKVILNINSTENVYFILFVYKSIILTLGPILLNKKMEEC